MSRVYDVVVWGSTGFTGKLVCEYLKKNYSSKQKPNALRWAIAGRNMEKLEDVHRHLSLGSEVDIIEADLSIPESLDSLISKTSVVLTTAGPYAKIGTPIVESCVRCGTNYCDITGEVPWVRTIADQFDEAAKEKKIKIVNCCGYDCIPSDLGVQMMVEQALRRPHMQVQEVRLNAGDGYGGVSGGTIASVLNMLETSSLSQLQALGDPYCLNPLDPATGRPLSPSLDPTLRARASDCSLPGYDPLARAYTAPYMMQGVDTRLVNRSNALQDWRYGRTMVFSERSLVSGPLMALMQALLTAWAGLLLVLPPSRALLKRLLPSPGQGPSQKVLDQGFFKMSLWAKVLDVSSGQESVLRGSIEALHGDPGYRQTAKMVAETAVSLALDGQLLPARFGVVTPSVGLGPVLRERLSDKGVVFRVEE